MNKNYLRAATAAGFAVVAALVLSACAMPVNMGGNAAFNDDGDANMADVMFVQMMIPHHKQALEMSELILANDDVDPDVTALAEQIKAAQDPEIELMLKWLEEWGIASADDLGGMDTMAGMMSDEQMAQLEDASGAEGSRLFLELMIEHHDGAVDMAEDVIRSGRNADVRALAEVIIEAQTREIATMRELLAR